SVNGFGHKERRAPGARIAGSPSLTPFFPQHGKEHAGTTPRSTRWQPLQDQRGVCQRQLTLTPLLLMNRADASTLVQAVLQCDLPDIGIRTGQTVSGVLLSWHVPPRRRDPVPVHRQL